MSFIEALFCDPGLLKKNYQYRIQSILTLFYVLCIGDAQSIWETETTLSHPTARGLH